MQACLQLPRRSRICGRQAKYRRSREQCKPVCNCRGAAVYVAARPNIAEAGRNCPIRFAWSVNDPSFLPFSLDGVLQLQDGEVDFNLGFGFIGLHVLAEQVGHDFPAFLHEGLLAELVRTVSHLADRA